MSSGIKKTKTAAIPPTVYEPSPATLKNFPSSVVNGITAEGGLLSLTFKSVACANLVENLDWMRSTILGSKESVVLPRINSDVFDGKSMLEELKAENEKLSQESVVHLQHPEFDALKRKLDEMVENKTDISQFGEDLKNDFNQRNPNKQLLFTDGGVKIKKVDIPDLTIDVESDPK
jgi:hypothetical protein